MQQTIQDKLLSSLSARQWQLVGIKHHHGINIPLFSLVTEKSTGIGEYLDLLPLIDFCNKIGFDVIQLLPLYDTGLETSPYNSLSAFALNPIFISLSELPYLEKMSDLEEKIAILRKYNVTPRIKYNQIRELKKEFLKEYFERAYPEISKTEEYVNFTKKNSWLDTYALFKSIKEEQNYRSWEDWPLSYKSPSEIGFKDLLQEYKTEIAFHTFLQFLSFNQMEKAKKYAEEKGVLIKGDIPILINRDSADVWGNRRYFLLNLSAGAPPDMIAPEGQNWGFPIYDWEEMEKSGYPFWKERLTLASSLFHIYRLDHIVGFFRIWAIPIGKKATEGGFLPADENTWIAHGRKIMEMMLKSSPLFPIGEDLGTVPPSARQELRNLGICTTKVIRWERRWETDGNYIPISEYIPESMTTVSTHDCDTLQLWWRHFPKEALLYSKFKGWDYKPFLSLDRHYDILKDSHESQSLFHINLLPEYLALFPELVSTNAHDERINIPGKILPTNWTYRLKVPLEKLFTHPFLIKTMRELIK
jgi:4-alpha-glucanotransferase